MAASAENLLKVADLVARAHELLAGGAFPKAAAREVLKDVDLTEIVWADPVGAGAVFAAGIEALLNRERSRVRTSLATGRETATRTVSVSIEHDEPTKRSYSVRFWHTLRYTTGHGDMLVLDMSRADCVDVRERHRHVRDGAQWRMDWFDVVIRALDEAEKEAVRDFPDKKLNELERAFGRIGERL